jgi:hypothetical protein
MVLNHFKTLFLYIYIYINIFLNKKTKLLITRYIFIEIKNKYMNKWKKISEDIHVLYLIKVIGLFKNIYFNCL